MPDTHESFKFPDETDSSKQELEIVVETESDTSTQDNKEPEDKVDVEVVDDTPPRDRGRVESEPPSDVTEDELKEYSAKVRKRLQHFSKGLHDQRRAAEAAQRERDEAIRYAQQIAEENKRLKTTAGSTQAALLDQAKKTTAIELEQAKQAFKDAYEAGNADELVKAQEALTTAKLKSDRIANIRVPSLQEAQDAVQQRQVASEPQVDPKAVKWQEANPWFGQDDEMTSFALGLHQKLVKEGVNPQSETYYERINARMRQVFPTHFGVEEQNSERQPASRKSTVVAPATRSIAPTKIVLTKTQVALAKRLNVPLEEYAKQVAAQYRKENG